MRILFLSDNFPPESNAPATRLFEHSVRWVRDGHDVTVITCAPNFPEGKLYAGYRNKWRQVEIVSGIRVIRVKTYISANEGFLKRTLDYMSFMVMAFVMSLFEKRPNVLVATSPQFFAAIGGWAAAALRRVPFVFELRDLWPASIVAVGAMEKSKVIRLLEKVELFLYRRSKRIISVTNSFKADLIDRGINPDKIDVVINGVDLDRYEPLEKDLELMQTYGLEGKFVCGYIGTHGMAHALTKVLDAAEMLKGEPSVAFFFAGSGADRASVERLVIERGLDNVVMIPRQPKDKMPALWSLCDVAIVPLRDTPVFSTVIPSKIFEAMGMGIPILMSLPEGEATQIIRSTGSGVCVAPESPTEMATAIKDLLGHPDRVAELRKAGLAAAPHYSRDKQATLMLEYLSKVASYH